jgi:hypothetical protein
VNWLRANGHALRLMWAVAGVMAGVVLGFGTAADGLIFVLTSGGYPGHAHDRHVAWVVTAWLAVAWVVVLAAMIWPAIRWKRRGMFARPSGPAGQERTATAGHPAR